MVEDDKPAFLRMVAGALASWDKDVTPATLNLWWVAMQVKAYPLARIQQAFGQYLVDPDKGHFAPRPADIVRIIEGGSQDHAVAAWSVVYEAAQRVGAYVTVVFDDPAAMAAINDMGGWPKLCRSETGEIEFVQKRFMDLYRSYRNMPGHPFPKRLPGDHSPDEEYEKIGVKPPPPTLIGDPARCAEVMAGGTSALQLSTTAAIHKLQLLPGGPNAKKNA